jgi:hypothetical protein
VKAGSHAEKIAKVYTLEAVDEIRLKSSGNVVIETKRLSVVGKGGFIDINAGTVTTHGGQVSIDCSSGEPPQGTPANPVVPNIADDGSKGGKL